MILIVDDQKDIGTVLERMFRKAGHEACSVTGGAEALAMMHVRQPSLLVLDVDMPEMNGLTILKRIREHAELKDLRVAMHSSETAPETIAEAMRLGALDFFVKGAIDLGSLVDRICVLSGEPTMPE